MAQPKRGRGGAKMRKEHDLLGHREVPDEAYYGIQTERENTVGDKGTMRDKVGFGGMILALHRAVSSRMM